MVARVAEVISGGWGRYDRSGCDPRRTPVPETRPHSLDLHPKQNLDLRVARSSGQKHSGAQCVEENVRGPTNLVNTSRDATGVTKSENLGPNPRQRHGALGGLWNGVYSIGSQAGVIEMRASKLLAR